VWKINCHQFTSTWFLKKNQFTSTFLKKKISLGALNERFKQLGARTGTMASNSGPYLILKRQIFLYLFFFVGLSSLREHGNCLYSLCVCVYNSPRIYARLGCRFLR
jgi:hypothetical protein